MSFIRVDGVDFALLDGRDPPVLTATCILERWFVEIRFWKNKQAMIEKVVPNEAALPKDLREKICDAVDAHRDALFGACKWLKD